MKVSRGIQTMVLLNKEVTKVFFFFCVVCLGMAISWAA